MMKAIIKLSIMLIFSLVTLSLRAQNTSVISGWVKDGGDQKVINSATVTLVKAKDSGLVKSSVTDKEGNFSFENVKEGTYIVVATSVGHKKTYSKTITAGNGNVSVGVLQLEAESRSLKEVVVTAKKPLIERKIDKTILNVDASISNAGSTALEVLETAPGVTVDKDGNVSLKGKDGVIIMIDGKPAYLSGTELANYLKNMPSSALDQIEIMTNPSAKYDASGNAGIINIKTKKNKLKGFNGNVSSSYGQGKGWRSSNSINMNYRNNKVNLFGNYSYTKNDSYQELDILRNFRNSTTKQLETIFNQYSSMQNISDDHTLKAGMDYYANKKTTLGVVFTGIINPSHNFGTNNTYLEDPYSNVDSILYSTNDNKEKMHNAGVNLNLRHTYDSTGREITADLDYIRYKQEDGQFFVNNYLNPDRTTRQPSDELRGSLPADLKIYSAKVDYTLPLKKSAKIEAGAKTSYVTTDNNALYEDNINGTWMTDYGKTNHFIYKENINAGYINLSKQIKKWGLQAGLRAENTNATGQQLGNAQKADSSFKLNYTSLFPTFFASYEANKKHTFSFSYGRRIDRPDYQDLNPFYYFLDKYTYQVGNTTLRPQYSNVLELSHTYKGFLTTTINYSNTKDLFTETFNQINSERITFVSKGNIATKTDIGLSVSASFPVTKVWTMNVYTNLINQKYSGALYGGILNVNGTTFMTNVSSQFKFKKGWSADARAFYRTGGIETELVMQAYWEMSAGVQKMVLKDKGTIKLGLRTAPSFHAAIKYQDIDASFVNNNYRTMGTLTFTYRFGKPFKVPQGRKTGGADDEQNRVKKGND